MKNFLYRVLKLDFSDMVYSRLKFLLEKSEPVSLSLSGFNGTDCILLL